MRGLIASLAASVARDTSNASSPAQWLIDWVSGGSSTVAGERVGPETAMRLSAVWACVKVRADDVAKLPLILYRKRKDGGKERADKHPLFDLIRNRPNPRMTAFEFRQMLQAQIDLRGNAYAIKETNGRGQIIALWPICPTKVTVLQSKDGRELFYRIHGYGDPLPAEFVLHLRGLSLDGVVGLSPISYHRETIGLGVAALKYGAAFFGNSAQPHGALKVPHVLEPEAAARLRTSWEARFKGSNNAKQIAIFDGGMEWVQTGMDNTDAQYLETRQFQNRDIWRLYRMPPHKVSDLEKATFSNIEQQALEYVTDCLMPELVRWEQSLARDLLSDEDRADGYFFEFLVDALLRGDFKSRMEGYAIGRNWGLFSVNDCLDKENMNRVENGDIRLQPLNMIEAGTKPPIKATAPDLSPDGAKELIKHLQLHLARSEQAGAPNGHAHEGAPHHG